MAKFLRLIRDELRQFPRNPKNYPRLTIKSLESRPQVRYKTLMYRATVNGETDKYLTSVQFTDVDFQKEKDKDHILPIKAEGTLYYYKVPSVGRNEAKLKCSCMDFRFRWEKELWDEKALIGTFRKYVRKTPMPPAAGAAVEANPDHVMGYCKHVHSLLLALRDAGFLKS